MLKVISCGIDEALVQRLDKICSHLKRSRNDMLKEMITFCVKDLEDSYPELASIIMLAKPPVTTRDLAAEVEARAERNKSVQRTTDTCPDCHSIIIATEYSRFCSNVECKNHSPLD